MSQPSQTPDAKQPAKARKPTESLDDHYKRWERQAKAMHDNAASIDWKGVDWSKLDPSQPGVHLGPPMTAEQFAEYRKRRGGPVHVLGAQPNKKP